MLYEAPVPDKICACTYVYYNVSSCIGFAHLVNKINYRPLLKAFAAL